MAKLKASIDFGLVHIPVEMVSAEDRSNAISFHMFDSKDKSRIRLKRVNENTGKEVEWEDIVKGYEVEKDEYVFFTNEELNELQEEANRSLAIDLFVDKSEVPEELFETPYYIVPAKGGEKAYAILQKVLESTEKYGLVQAVIRTRQKLGVIYAADGGLVLELLRYPEEIKEITEVIPEAVTDVKVTQKEISMAEKLVEQMSGEFKPEKYKDDYASKVEAAVERKLKGKGPRRISSRPSGKIKKTVDIMELLAGSLKSAKKAGTAQQRKSKRA